MVVATTSVSVSIVAPTPRERSTGNSCQWQISQHWSPSSVVLRLTWRVYFFFNLTCPIDDPWDIPKLIHSKLILTFGAPCAAGSDLWHYDLESDLLPGLYLLVYYIILLTSELAFCLNAHFDYCTRDYYLPSLISVNIHFSRNASEAASMEETSEAI